MDNKEKTSRSSSSQNLNESSRPLLDEEEVRGGDRTVAIEMDRKEEATVTAGEDTEKECAEEKVEDAKADGKGTESKKEKKEKKKVKKEEKKSSKRRSSLTEKLTAGLNVLDRDDKNVNDHINITFEDVLAEPDSNHTFECVWRNSFIVFDQAKFWFYRILSAIFFIPFAFVWGIIFAVLTCLNVWIISPFLRTFDVVLYIIHRVWSGIIRTFLDPLFKSVGQVCSNVKLTHRRLEQEV